jgi:hypothetical protein
MNLYFLQGFILLKFFYFLLIIFYFLQGFIIFLIVVMKSKVIRSIRSFLLGLPRIDSFRSRSATILTCQSLEGPGRRRTSGSRVEIL